MSNLGKTTDQALKEVSDLLVVANHILARQQVVDAFGHVSQRSPQDPERFFISRSMPPALVRAEDIVELDLDGVPVEPDGPALYLERFIHSEIYRARPDVMAVVHSHSPSVLPFAVVPEMPLQCICHTATFIGTAAPVFEIRDHDEDPGDLLVRNASLGKALARCLGKDTVVLMRGHGSTAVGATLQHAVFNAIYAEINARIQLDAVRLGNPTYLSQAEVDCTAMSEPAVNRAWELWTSEVS